MFLKNWTKGVVNSIKAMLTKKINVSKFNFSPLILVALVLSLFLCLIVDRENRFDGYAAETPMFTYNGVEYYKDRTSGSVTLSHAYDISASGTAGTPIVYLYSDGTLIFEGSGNNKTYNESIYLPSYRPWKDETITRIAISKNGFKPSTLQNMFRDYNGDKIYQINYLNTSNVQSMNSCFWGCSNLTELDVSGFDTSNVSDMLGVFYNCSKLTTLNVSNFKTSKATTMLYLFAYCRNLTGLDVSKFDTSQVTNMNSMFEYCNNLTEIDLQNFNTSKVTDMSFMFYECKSLGTIDLSKFNTASVKTMSSMFGRCYGLTEINLSTFDMNNVTGAGSMFLYCTKLNKIILPSNLNATDCSLPTEYGVWYKFNGDNKVDDIQVTKLISKSSSCDNLRAINILFIDDSTGINYYKDGTSGSVTLSNTYDLNSAGTQKAYLYSNGMLILDGLYDSSSSTNYFNNANELPWYGKTVDKIAISNNGYAPTNTKLLFANYTGSTIYQLEKLDTSHVENMESMFSGCSALTQLDLSHFDTSNVTNIWCMFMDCISLTKLDLSSFNTTAVSSMGNTFWGCTGLTELNISNFSISSTTYCVGLFQSCNKLNKIVLPSSVDVTDIGLPTVTGHEWFKYKENTKVDNTNVTNLIAKSTSYDNIRLINLCLYKNSTGVEYYQTGSSAGATCVAYDLTDTSKSPAGSCMAYYYSDRMLIFDGAGVTKTYDGYSLPWGIGGSGIQVDNIAISKNGFQPTSMSYLFSECKGTTIYQLEYLDTSNVTDMKYLFNKCRNLVSLDLSNFNTAKVTDMSHMFSQCNALTTLNVSSFDTSAVTNMNNMFDGCSVLNNLNVSNFNTAKVTDMQSMFDSCEKLSSLNLSNFNTAKVTDMQSMFSGCKALTTLNVSSFNTAQVTDMQSMFSWCNALTSLNLSSFDTRAVTMMNGMFVRCDALVSLTLGNNFKTNNVTSMYQMFANCYALNTLNLSGFNTANVTNMYNIFMNNYALTELDLSKFEIKDLETLPPDLSTLSGLTKIKLPAYIKDGTTISLPYSDDSIWVKYNGISVVDYTPITRLIAKSEGKYDCVTLISKDILYTDNMGTPDDTSDDVIYYNVGTSDPTITLDKYDSDNDGTPDTTCVWDLNSEGKVKAYLYTDGTLILDGEGNIDLPFNNGSTDSDTCHIIYPWRQYKKLTSIKQIYGSNDKFIPHGSIESLFDYTIDGTYYTEHQNEFCIKEETYGPINVSTVDVTNFDLKHVTNASCMFKNFKTKGMIDIYLEGLDLSSCTDLSGMLSCMRLDNNYFKLHLKNWKLNPSSNVNLKSFFGSSRASVIDVSGWTNTQSISDISDFFSWSYFSGTLDLSSFHLTNTELRNSTKVSNFLNGVTIANQIILPTDIDSNVNINLKCGDDETWYGYDSSGNRLNLTKYNKLVKSEGNATGKLYKLVRQKVLLYTDNHDPSNVIEYYKTGTNKTVEPNKIELVKAFDITDTSKSQAGSCMAYLYSDGMMIFDGEGYVKQYSATNLPWYLDSFYDEFGYQCEIKHIAISNYKFTPKGYANYLFAGAKCDSIYQLNLMDTKDVNEMKGLFLACSSLTSLDLSSFNTAKVTSMYELFDGCSALTSLDLSSFNTAKVTSMCELFNNCNNITTLDLSSFNTAKVTDMSYMFYNCKQLSTLTLDVNSFDTTNVTNMSCMFYECNNLLSLDVSKFNTAKVTNMTNMFRGCSSLTTLDLSSFNTSQVTDMSMMFTSCSLLTEIDISNFDTALVGNMQYMFSGCSSLETLKFKIDDSALYYTPYMFRICDKLKTLDLTGSTLSNNILPISSISSLNKILLPKTVTGSAVDSISLPTASWVMYGNDNKLINDTLHTKLTGYGDDANEGKYLAVGIPISGATATFDTVTYNGSSQTPNFTLKYNSTTLVKDTDYEIVANSWTNNKNATTSSSKASVKVIGKGKYVSEKIIEFEIGSAPLEINFDTTYGKSSESDTLVTINQFIDSKKTKVFDNNDNIIINSTNKDNEFNINTGIGTESFKLSISGKFNDKLCDTANKVKYTFNLSEGNDQTKLSNYNVTYSPSLDDTNCYEVDGSISKYTLSNDEIESIMDDFENATKTYDGTDVVKWNGNLATAKTITILGFDISFIIQGKYQGNTDNISVGTNKIYKLDLSFDNTASNYTNVTNNIKLPDGGVSKTYTSGSITASGVNSLTIQNNFPSEIEYDSKEHKPTINDIKVLKDGVEITNIADEFEIVLDNTKNYKDGGSYTFTVKAKDGGNYSGTKDLSFDIKPCKIMMSDLLLDTYTSSNPLIKEYDGSLSFEENVTPTIRFKKQIDDSNKLDIILDYDLTNSKYENVSGRAKDNLGGKSLSERDKRDLIFSDVKLKSSDTNNYVLIDSDGTTVLNKFNSVSFDDCGQIVDTTKPVVLSSTKSVTTVGKGGTLRITLTCSEDIVHDFTIPGFDASKLYIELFSKASNVSCGKAVINTDSSLTKDKVLVFDYQVPTDDSFKNIRVEGFTIEIKNESSGVLLADDCNNELVLDPLSDTVKDTFNDLVIDTRGIALNINAYSDNTFTNEINRDSITNLFDIYYKFTFGSDVTGFDVNDIDVTNGTVSDFTKVDNKTYTCKVSNIGKLQGTDTNGIVQTVSVAKDKAQDANSNYNVADTLNLTIKRNLIIKDETLLLNIPGLDTATKVIIKTNDILNKVSYSLYEIFNNVVGTTDFASGDTLTITDITTNGLIDKYIIKVNGHKADYIDNEETYTYLIKNIDHIAKEIIDKVLPNLNPSDSDLRDIIKDNDNKDIYELPEDVRDILTNDNTNKVTDLIIVAIKDLIDDKRVDELDDSNIIKDEIAPIIVEIARLSDKITDITTDAMDYEERMIKYQSLSVYQKEYMNRHYHDEIENLHNKYYELIESCKSNTIESLDNEDSEVVEVYGVINKLQEGLTDADTEAVRSLSVEKINEEEKLNKINETLESESLLSDKKVIIPYDIKILLDGSPVENVKTGEKLLIKLKLPIEFFDAVFKIYHLDKDYNFKEEIDLTKQLIDGECLIYFFADSFSPYIPVSTLRTIRIESNDTSLGMVNPLGLNAVNVGENFTISITPNQGYYANVIVNGTKVKDKFNGGNYELTNIQDNKDVFVEFVKNEEPQKPAEPEKPSITNATVITIQNANHMPYIDGYKDKTFRPNNNMTRAEFTKVISTISNNFNLSYDNDKYITKYKDVKEDSWYSNYVGYVTKLGLMKGYSDGTFKPNNYITRAEVSKVLSDMFNVPDKQIKNIFFNELNGHWYFNSTNELIKGGVIKGYKDGTFKPNNNITRAEVITLINRVKDREIDKDIDKGYLNMMDSKFKDVSKSNWFYNDLVEASIAHNSFDLH